MLGLLLTLAVVDPQVVGGIAARREIPAQESSAAPTEWRVVLAAPVYQPDGAVSVETTTVSNAANLSYVFGRRSVCDTATTTATEPAQAAFGWRLISNTVSQTPTQLVVSIDWRRMWDHGQKLTNGPAGTVQLTLHPGDRIPLDHIPNPMASDACRAVGIGLEVRLSRVPAMPPPAQVGRGEPASGPVLPLGAMPGGAGPLKADVWLLHTHPSGTEEVLYQTVQLQTDGGSFVFPTLKVATTRGELGVEMSGTIQRFRLKGATGEPAGDELLFMQFSRLLTGAPTPPGGLRNTTAGTSIALPPPTDVLNFELPSAQMRGGGGGGRGGAGAGTVSAGAVAMAPRSAAPVQAQGGARGGGGGGARSGEVAVARLGAVQATALLEGNVFALRVRLAAQ